jgi:hypothetical protein
MQAVVQASCPGCKATLRIPSDWLGQTFRCKQCGMVIQSRPAAPSSPTPPPSTRQTAPPPPPAPPAPPPVTSVAPAVPLAAPVGYTPHPPLAGADAFTGLEAPHEEPAPATRARQKRKKAGWKGPVIALLVIAVSVIASVVLWANLSPILFAPIESSPSVTDRPGGDPGPRPAGDRGGKPAGGGGRLQFPRRALIVSVHNYLYANPVHSGNGSDRPLTKLSRSLNKGLKIPMTQIAYLSDEARTGEAVPPLKPAIERTLTGFLEQCRAQDHIIVFFIGHSAEVDGEVYLVPVEGDMKEAGTLIPLKWVYRQMADCKARQKVLVLDVNRFNPTIGLERPDSGPMGDQLAEAVAKPPEGVQVWTSCSKGQRSYGTDTMPGGVFISRLCSVLEPYRDQGEKGLEGKIQNPDEPMPLARINEAVNREMEKELRPHKLTQTAQVFGASGDSGAEYDPDEPPAPEPKLARVEIKGGRRAMLLLEGVRGEISTPPVKPSSNTLATNFDILPPFDPDKLKNYEEAGPPDTKLKKAIARARYILWAVSTSGAPKEIEKEVAEARDMVQVDLSVMQNGYRAPAPGMAETRFKEEVRQQEARISEVMLFLQEALDELEIAGEEERDKATVRWQANYDIIHARMQAQMAFLYEYQSMLGGMRTEFPPRDPAIHNGWRLASTTDLQGDRAGRRLATKATRTLDKVIEKHKGTPWEVLAKRLELTALGLQWQPSQR